MSNFPAYYPAQCPPCDAKDIDGSIFRFTGGDIPNQEDFRSFYELKRKYDAASECQAMGLSVFTSIDDCQEMKKKIPALRKKKIATACLNKNYGKFAHTPSTNSKRHMTWWLYHDLDEPWNLFVIVDN